MYTVRMEISATESRKRLFKLFDAVDRGDDVRIVRRGTVYRLTVVGPRKRTPKPSVTLEWVDPAVERGQWTFEPSSRGGVTFKARR
jgi:antitoxin (DNA-binding transcriptional repressor) of toxin-antitoxin stability system